MVIGHGKVVMMPPASHTALSVGVVRVEAIWKGKRKEDKQEE